MEAESPTHSKWSPAARVAFRFAFAYLVLFTCSPAAMWDAIVPGLARAAFGVEIIYRPNGSGDTTYNYVQLFASVSLALLAAGLWSALDREREAYPKLGRWTLVVARYYLAMMMIGYGVVKICGNQFPQPSLATLMTSYGTASPMGLAWTFTGFSPAYQAFGGLLELSAALLLAFRRTTTVGALLCAGVMSNVVMLNYCFDIAAKILSTHLLLLALVIASLDARRLVDALLRNRATEPVEHAPHFSNPKLHVAGRVVKGLALATMLLLNVWVNASYALQDRERSPVYGVWQVEELREDGVDRPALVTDAERWRYLIFDRSDSLVVQHMDGSFSYYDAAIDLDAGTLTLSEVGERWGAYIYLNPPLAAEPVEHAWTVDAHDGQALELSGALGGPALRLRATAQPLDFLLTTRGFNWVNETPLNE